MGDTGMFPDMEFIANYYKPDLVPRHMIESMLESARQAPSACNRQPWRFVVVTDAATRRALCEQGLLPGIRAGWVGGAPVIIAVGMALSAAVHRVAPLFSKVDYPWIDIGIAGEHLVLQATEFGLGTCWIGWIQPAKVRKIVGWPSAVRPAALITVGWPQDPAATSRMSRKPLDQIATWRE